MLRLRILLFLLAVLLLAGCRPAEPAAPTAYILTSTTFLADITGHIAGERIQVVSLLPPGVDPHSYQPVPADVTRIARSQLLVINGADYEEFIESLLENAGDQKMVIVASSGLAPRAGSEHGVDPHFWLDPNNVIAYVETIRRGLLAAEPDGEAIFAANSAAYINELRELDAWVRAQVEQIPPERRLLVTNHDSLGYFAERYGFTVVGAVVPGLSSESATSARQMAALIEQIRATGAPAIFLDASDNPELADQVAAETGVRVVDDLYIEALTGPGGDAPTYIAMIRHNVTRIVEALR